MNVHPANWYIARNREIIKQRFKASPQELAAQYGLKPERIKFICTYANPKREPSLYLLRRDELPMPGKSPYVATLAHLKRNPGLFYACVVAMPSGCWHWRYRCNKSGYGYLQVARARLSAHRVSAWLVGIIASPKKPKSAKDPSWVLHSCDNPVCCNPAHLRSGTLADNSADMAKKGRARNGTTGKLAKAHHQGPAMA